MSASNLLVATLASNIQHPSPNGHRSSSGGERALHVVEAATGNPEAALSHRQASSGAGRPRRSRSRAASARASSSCFAFAFSTCVNTIIFSVALAPLAFSMTRTWQVVSECRGYDMRPMSPNTVSRSYDEKSTPRGKRRWCTSVRRK